MLFQTVEGQDIFIGDEFFYLKDWDVEKGIANILNAAAFPTFSTKEAADSFVLMNKPCLSINDVIKAMQNNVVHSKEYGTHIHGTKTKMELISLVKDKLNNK